MKSYAIFLILLIFLNLSCKKDNEIVPQIKDQQFDTIKPYPYLPVYPGSWWIYVINDTDTVYTSVSAKYVLHSFRATQNVPWITQIYSDSVYVPFLDSKPIYGYEKIEWIYPPFGDYYKKWPILSEQIGFCFKRDFTDMRYGDYAEYVEVKNKVFNGSDSIILLEGHWVYGPNITHKSYQEFMKWVGLTKEFVIDTISNDTIYKKQLVNFFINK